MGFSVQKRKIRKKAVEAEEGTLDIAALEAEAAAADGAQDRGSRADKATKDAKLAKEREADLLERKNRCLSVVLRLLMMMSAKLPGISFVS